MSEQIVGRNIMIVFSIEVFSEILVLYESKFQVERKQFYKSFDKQGKFTCWFRESF